MISAPQIVWPCKRETYLVFCAAPPPSRVTLSQPPCPLPAERIPPPTTFLSALSNVIPPGATSRLFPPPFVPTSSSVAATPHVMSPDGSEASLTAPVGRESDA